MIPQLRTEKNETVSGRIDMLSSVNTALPKVSAKPSCLPFQETWKAAMTRENSDTSRRTCTCGCKRGQTKEKQCMSALRALTSSTIAHLQWIVQKRISEQSRTSLYQVLHRTTGNEPLRKVQRTNGQKGLDARHANERRYDRRNTSHNNSACAALINNVSKRDSAKDVEHFDDMLRTFINETNKFESRIGTIRDDEKMLAVRKLMAGSFLNCRFGGTTMSHNELLIALKKSSLTRLQQSRQPET